MTKLTSLVSLIDKIFNVDHYEYLVNESINQESKK